MAQPVRTTRRPVRWLVAPAVILALWFSGLIGFAMRPLLRVAAARISSDLTIAYQGRADVADPRVGASLTVSEARLRRLAHDLIGWKAYFIPPGLVPRQENWSGRFRAALEAEQEPIVLPVVLRITPAASVPMLKVRLPSDLVNEALDYDGSFASRTKRHAYVLGHYDTSHHLHFDTVTLSSELADKERNKPVTFRRIAGQATGEVRFRVKENIGRATVKARVRRMELRCDLDFKKYMDGLALAYRITIPKLDADIRHVAPIFEGRPTESLRQMLEESMARPRKLERMARKRFPAGIPLDLAFQLEVFKSDVPDD